MRILEDIYLVGSGQFGISHPSDCHVYLVDGGSEIALVDTGAGIDVEALLSNVEAAGFGRDRIGKVLLTHHHADHSGGCGRLLEQLSLETYLHEDGVRFVRSGDHDEMGLTVAKGSGIYPHDYVYTAFEPSDPFEDGQTISVGHYSLSAHHVPGHSPDATCFLMEWSRGAVLFAGDIVFFGGRIGLLNRSGSSLEQYRSNFWRMTELNFDSLLPGHGVFVVHDGKKHVEMAEEALRKLPPPPNFL